MALFSLIAKLGLDKSGFDTGMNAAQAKAAQFGSALKSQLAAAFSVAAITAYTHSLIRYASQVHDAAKRTGASTDAIQTLGYAAKQTGSDFEAVVRSFKDLSKARQEALDTPNSKAAQVFAALGISAKQLKDLKLEDLFRAIGRGFERNDFGASELAMVTELLGKSGAELLPMFKEGVDALEASARAAAAALRNGVINELDAVGDELDKLAAKLRGPVAEALLFVLQLTNTVLEKLGMGLRTINKLTVGFKQGFGGQGEPLGAKDIAKAVTPFGFGRLISRIFDKTAAGLKGANEQLGAGLFAQAAAPGAGGLLQGVLGALFQQIGGKRQKKEFGFENLLKEHEPRATRVSIQSDALGRIGGTVGGGDAIQSRLNEMVRELKGLRRTIEVRGIRITGEL